MELRRMDLTSSFIELRLAASTDQKIASYRDVPTTSMTCLAPPATHALR
jgi:hypothetical protein